MEALKYVQSGIVFAIASSGTLISVMLAIFILKESLTLIQLIGVITIVISISFFYYSSKSRIYKTGIVVSIISMIFSGVCSFILKVSAISLNIMTFMFTYSLLISIGALFLSGKNFLNKHSVKIGTAIGFINFVGVYAYLIALEEGPLSIIRPLVSVYVFIVAILSYIFYREKIPPKKILFMLLSVLGASLLVI